MQTNVQIRGVGIHAVGPLVIFLAQSDDDLCINVSVSQKHLTNADISSLADVVKKTFPTKCPVSVHLYIVCTNVTCKVPKLHM